MHSRMRRFARRTSTGRWLFAGLVISALVATPFALAAGEGTPVKGGARNPSSNPSSQYAQETQIIASNGTYGTRQSNKGTGGGAIYGCRSLAGAPPCVRAVNLNKGRAFEFATGGTEGGFIDVPGGDAARPFSTNATGVATGLNADRVDSKNAAQIESEAVATAQGLNLFAMVNSDGSLAGGRGAVSAAPGTPAGDYKVVFASDISKCALSATETVLDDAGAVGVQIESDAKTVDVRTRAGGGADGTGATTPAKRPFHLTVIC